MEHPRLPRSAFVSRKGLLGKQIVEWFSSALGTDILAAEQALCERILPAFFGYHVVQLAATNQGLNLSSSTIKHRCTISDATAYLQLPPDGGQESLVIGTAESLPLQSESVDVIVLHHALDFSSRPQKVLREVERCLISGGKLVIIGFNPWSMLGIGHFLFGHTPRLPWCANFLSANRTAEWLSVLELKVDGIQSGYFEIPLKLKVKPAWVAIFEGLFARLFGQLGSVYMLVATKQQCRISHGKRHISSVSQVLTRPTITAATRTHHSHGEQTS